MGKELAWGRGCMTADARRPGPVSSEVGLGRDSVVGLRGLLVLPGSYVDFGCWCRP